MGEPMIDPEFLSSLVSRIRAIASDCFDLRAVERLRAVAEEIDQKISAPPTILTQSRVPGGESEAT
jgi:hypothetical protein